MPPDFIKFCINTEFPDNTGYIHDATKHLLEIFFGSTKKSLKEVFTGTFEQLLAKHQHGYKWAKVRDFRQALLKHTDHTELEDYPRFQTEWKTYRQSLRDITNTFSDPNSVVWPMAPESIKIGSLSWQ